MPRLLNLAFILWVCCQAGNWLCDVYDRTTRVIYRIDSDDTPLATIVRKKYHARDLDALIIRKCFEDLTTPHRDV